MEFSNKIDLSQFKPRAHPFKAVFKDHKITLAVISNYLGLSHSYTYNILSGHYRMPRRIEKKLEPLVEQLLSEQGC